MSQRTICQSVWSDPHPHVLLSRFLPMKPPRVPSSPPARRWAPASSAMAPLPEERSASSLLPGEDAGEAVSSDLDSQISGHPTLPHPESHILHPQPTDDAAVGDLIDCESQTLPLGDYLQRCRSRSVNLTARQDSISWILKVYHITCSPPIPILELPQFLLSKRENRAQTIKISTRLLLGNAVGFSLVFEFYRIIKLNQ